jgi:hypothetical protein
MTLSKAGYHRCQGEDRAGDCLRIPKLVMDASVWNSNRENGHAARAWLVHFLLTRYVLRGYARFPDPKEGKSPRSQE